MKNLALLIVVLSFVVGGSFASAAVRDEILGPHQVIKFEPGRAVLTTDSRAKLRDLVNDARSMGKISEVQVAAWSDKGVPRAADKYAEMDRELAANRARAVEAFLIEQMKIADRTVATYNMAARNDWVSKSFYAPDAELPATFSKEGQKPEASEALRVFKANGRPTSAVVLMKYKDS